MLSPEHNDRNNNEISSNMKSTEGGMLGIIRRERERVDQKE